MSNKIIAFQNMGWSDETSISSRGQTAKVAQESCLVRPMLYSQVELDSTLNLVVTEQMTCTWNFTRNTQAAFDVQHTQLINTPTQV